MAKYAIMTLEQAKETFLDQLIRSPLIPFWVWIVYMKLKLFLHP